MLGAIQMRADTTDDCFTMAKAIQILAQGRDSGKPSQAVATFVQAEDANYRQQHATSVDLAKKLVQFVYVSNAGQTPQEMYAQYMQRCVGNSQVHQ